MSQLGQAPEPAQSGAFLQQESVGGTKVDFISSTVNAATTGGVAFASIAVPAGTAVNIAIDATLYDPLIPVADRTSANIIDTSKCQVFYYLDFFVDTDNDFNYELAVGPSLSADQLQVYARGQWDEKTPLVGTSQRRIMQLANGGASSHTVYIHSYVKYILSA
jgi:hypothetical protein